MELLWWLIAIVLLAVGPYRHGAATVSGYDHHSSPQPSFIASCSVRKKASAGERDRRFSFCSRLRMRSISLSGYFGAKYLAPRSGECSARSSARSSEFSSAFIGLFVGPVIGAIAGEFVAGKKMIEAGRAGWGSLLGNFGGMIGKLIIATRDDHDFSDDRAVTVLI